MGPDVIAAYLAGAQLLLSVAPLFARAVAFVHRKSKYEELGQSLNSYRDLIVKENPNRLKELLTLLDIGDVIMPHVVARFWRQVSMLLAVFVGTATATGIGFAEGHPKLSLAGGGLLVLVNWGLTLGKEVFSPTERAFLKNFVILQEMFYTEYVVGLMDDFNKACKGPLLTLTKEFEKDRQKWQAELEALSPTKQLPPASTDATGAKSPDAPPTSK